MVQIIDRTSATSDILVTRNGRNIFSRGRSSARRSIGSLEGIILHQTSFVSHSEERMDYIIANYVVMQDGRVLLVRDPEMMLNSIGTNQRCIDIEFVGHYASSRDVRRARGRALSTPSPAQVKAGRELVTDLKTRYGLSRIHAHVQFTQKNCPGPHLWYNVGEWAKTNLLMNSARGHAVPGDWQDTSLSVL